MGGESTFETYTTPWGVFTIDPVEDRQIANRLRAGSAHQGEAFDILSSFIKEGGVVVDAGAHIGTFSIPMGLRGRKVIAFEPSPAAFDFLQRNVALNTVPVDARNKGLGAKHSTAGLREGERGNAGSRSLIEGAGAIPVARLDDEVEHADAIKIDVEGMELNVLQGAQRLIETSKPVILFEVFLSQMRLYGSRPRALQSFFHSRGYTLYLLIPDKEQVRLGKLWNLSLAALFITPGTVFFNRLGCAFDVLAVPSNRAMSLPYSSAFATYLYIAGGKIIDVTSRMFKKLYR